jgi:hypothetical protein
LLAVLLFHTSRGGEAMLWGFPFQALLKREYGKESIKNCANAQNCLEVLAVAGNKNV